jgi:hypothetical protein
VKDEVPVEIAAAGPSGSVDDGQVHRPDQPAEVVVGLAGVGGKRHYLVLGPEAEGGSPEAVDGDTSAMELGAEPWH